MTNKFDINDVVYLDNNKEILYSVKGMLVHVLAMAGEKIFYRLNNAGDDDIFPAHENVHEDRIHNVDVI